MHTFLDQLVYIVDDDDAVRDSVAMLLNSEGIKTVAFSSPEQFLDDYTDDRRGCIILDVKMPGMNGLELQTKLVAASCNLPIIFITGHGDIPMAVEAIQNGAIEFLQKPFDDQCLIDAVHKALAVNKTLANDQLEKEDIRRRQSSLTPREREVMLEISKGHSNKAIAVDLGLSQRTVEVHRSNIMLKMGAKNLASLIYLTQIQH